MTRIAVTTAAADVVEGQRVFSRTGTESIVRNVKRVSRLDGCSQRYTVTHFDLYRVDGGLWGSIELTDSNVITSFVEVEAAELGTAVL